MPFMHNIPGMVGHPRVHATTHLTINTKPGGLELSVYA